MSWFQGPPTQQQTEELGAHVPLFVWYTGLVIGALSAIGFVIRTSLQVVDWVTGKAKTAAETERKHLAQAFDEWKQREEAKHAQILVSLESLQAQLKSALGTWQSNIGVLAGLQQWQVDLGQLLEQRKNQWETTAAALAELTERVRQLELAEHRRLEGR